MAKYLNAGDTDGDTRPVIGLGGFFGYGNYGDELFLEVFKEHLGTEFRLQVLPDTLDKPYFSVPVEERIQEVDAILIGGGDLVLPWSIDSRYFNSVYLQKPVFLAGLGVPIRAQGTANQVEKPHIIARHRNFFQHENIRFLNVRDGQSANWIRSKIDPKVEIIESPDLVCGLTLPAVQKPGTPILGIVTRHRPGHDQDDDYSKLVELGNYAISQGWKVRHIILGTGRVGQVDVVNAERVPIPGKEVVYSESLDDLSRAIGECSAQASMKFHGSVVATMYGVPSMVLVPTSKNRNFMRRMDRNDLLCRFDSPELVDRFKPFPEPIDPAWVERLRDGAVDMLTQLRNAIGAALAQR
ncbi:polysaccharide pyruvyl transferase family protein [Roseomonas sp. WA12]